MPQAIRFHEHGGPEVLRLESVEPGTPAADEVQIRHTAIGVNFIDVYDRTGLYPVQLPSGLGREAAGVVTAAGRKTRGFRAGDRVAYAYPKQGAYSEVRNVPASRLVKVPKGISDAQAAAILLKGLTAHFLLRGTYRVARGEFILVHAAAGGVGSILTQWGKSLGAKVIGVVGNEAKVELARRNGCRHVLLSGREIWCRASASSRVTRASPSCTTPLEKTRLWFHSTACVDVARWYRTGILRVRRRP